MAAGGSRVKASRNRRGPSPSPTPPCSRSGRQNMRKTSTTTAVSSTHGRFRSACRSRWPPWENRATSGPIPPKSPAGVVVVKVVTSSWGAPSDVAAHQPVRRARQRERRPAEEDQQPGRG